MMKKLAIALAVATLAPVAMAQSAGDFVARFRAVNVEPANDDDVAITDVSLNSKVIPEIDFTYFVTPNIAAELILTVPQEHDVSSTAHGGKIGTLQHLPPTLTAQYHFTGLPYGIKPYVGAGVNFTHLYKVNLPAGFDLENKSFGLALQAGVDVPITGNWSVNVDIKKVQMAFDLKSNGTSIGEVKVNPLLVGVGVGYKF